MAIDWISVKDRVPDDRRNVLVWGWWWFSPFPRNEQGRFAGKTSYNSSPSGGRFDCERKGYFGIWHITHWAEIEGPQPQQLLPPPSTP